MPAFLMILMTVNLEICSNDYFSISVLQTSLLFAKEEGLLSFLRKSLSNETVRGVYRQILIKIYARKTHHI